MHCVHLVFSRAVVVVMWSPELKPRNDLKVPVWAVLDYSRTKIVERELLLIKVSILGPEHLHEQLATAGSGVDVEYTDDILEEGENAAKFEVKTRPFWWLRLWLW